MGWGIIGDVVDAVGDAAESAGEWISDTAEDAADAVGDAAGAVAGAVEDAAEDVADAVDGAIDAIGDAVGDAVDAVVEGTDAIVDAVEQAAADAWDTLEDGWDHVSAAAEDAWEAVADAAEATWQGVSDAAESAWDGISDAAESGWEAVTSAAEHAWDTVSNGAEAAWDRAAEIVEAGLDELAKAYEWAVQAAADTIEWLGGVLVDLGELFLQLGACLAGQIVYRAAKAGNVIANIYKLPKLLSSDFKDDMKRVLGSYDLAALGFDTVYYIDDASLTANWFGGGGTAAMTFAGVTLAGLPVSNAIFVRDPWDETDATDRELMAHELVHVLQYRRFITESGFACAYGIGYAKSGFDYRTNPLEAEAYSFVAANTGPITA
jgi:hypothetical protein